MTTTSTQLAPVRKSLTLTGRVVPYETSADLGAFTESFARGCFADSIENARHGIPLLIEHNRSKPPIGRAKIEDFEERADGLYARFTLDRSPEAIEAHRLAEQGLQAYLSVGFKAIRSTTTKRGQAPHVHHVKARLLEVSLTAIPAYAEATVTNTRSADHYRAWLNAQPLPRPTDIPRARR